MINHPGWRLSIVVVACMGLAACGFRLAGTTDLPAELSTIHLITHNFTELEQSELRGRLIRAGASVVDQSATDAIVLAVTLKSFPDRRLASTGSSGKFVERIKRGLDYSLKYSSGEAIVPSRTLQQQKDTELDENSLLASNRERESIKTDLQEALFKQLLNQLQRIKFGS